MKIFVLEDDYNCKTVIEWLQDKSETIKIVDNLEDAYYFLEYEDEFRHYDKYIIDASVRAASVLYLDGTQKSYNSTLNGIDFVVDNFEQMGIDKHKVAFLTAFYFQVNDYLKLVAGYNRIKIINKNDSDLTRRLQEFLDS